MIVLFVYGLVHAEPADPLIPILPGKSDPAIKSFIRDLIFKNKEIIAQLDAEKNISSPSKIYKDISILEKSKEEISYCLQQYSFITSATRIVPNDTRYLAHQNKTLAESDLSVALTWWKYCGDNGTSKGDVFEEWPKAKELKFVLQKAEADFRRNSSEKDDGKEPKKGALGMNQDMSRGIRLQGELGTSLLDQIDGWKDLPTTEKAKFRSR
ncbi:MAG: hypothetical protein QM627_01750 [Luteolibacter sp.]